MIPITSRVVRGECACLYGVVTFSSGGTAVWGLALENGKSCQRKLKQLLLAHIRYKPDYIKTSFGVYPGMGIFCHSR